MDKKNTLIKDCAFDKERPCDRSCVARKIRPVKNSDSKMELFCARGKFRIGVFTKAELIDDKGE